MVYEEVWDTTTAGGEENRDEKRGEEGAKRKERAERGGHETGSGKEEGGTRSLALSTKRRSDEASPNSVTATKLRIRVGLT